MQIPFHKLISILFALCLAPHYCFAVPADGPVPEQPSIAKASDDAEKALTGFKVPAGLTASLFSAEPMLANPVAFAIDPRGRIFVCETFRQGKGVEDNRGHGHWLDDDLAAMTVADRIAYVRKHLKEKANDYTKHDDRLRLLEDTDGDGKADKATIFAERFNNLEDGTGAGVLAYRGDVFYTNIPKLYRLRDKDNDGQADERDTLHDGYGVRFAFRGHDLHGLIIGPDGRLYFSVGDRGLNVKQGDKQFVNPSSGAVMRCELDGSNLELFATGLRNPQELAFDGHGNLFTGDNNSDSGDKARWVYVVEGGDTGWRMYYQYLPDRGPFNREKIWHPPHAGQPAYIVPPITNFADGPSGLAYYPGTGLPEHFRNRFFLCDFRGGPANSGVKTFRTKAKGAGFELVDAEDSFWRVLATDVDFGPDGSVYISDWVNGWNGEGKGRIYKFAAKEESQSAIVKQVQELLSKGLANQSPAELLPLLGHADRRIRQEAQFELVRRKELATLATAAQNHESLLARLHGIWGVGQAIRLGADRGPFVPQLISLIDDPQPEVRAQSLRVLGEMRETKAIPPSIAKLRDDEPRVRYFAAMLLSKTGGGKNEVCAMLADNADRDPWLRHAGIMALTTESNNNQAIDYFLQHPSSSVRLAAVVALRKKQSPRVVDFLKDTDPQVVLEAARAVHDAGQPELFPALAALITTATTDDALLRRVLNANYRLGMPANAVALATFATSNAPQNMKLEALAMLDQWGNPSPKDRVTNEWRPLPTRDPAPAKEALLKSLPKLLAATEKVRQEAAKVAARQGIADVGPALVQMFEDRAQPGRTRADALTALVSLKDAQAEGLRDKGLTDADAVVRGTARGLLAKTNPKEALPQLADATLKGNVIDRQLALETLATLTESGTNAVLGQALDQLLAGEFPAEATLDLLEAAEKRAAGDIKAKVKKYQAARPANDDLVGFRETLVGGDAAAGRRVFFEKTDVSCVRCHKIGETGGEVGPNLSKIGSEKTREYLLEAMVLPNKAIAKNFESALVVDDSGKVHTGVVKFENEERLDLVTAEGKLVQLKKSEIENRRPAKSPMPDDLMKKMSKRELRDVVEFLQSLKP